MVMSRGRLDAGLKALGAVQFGNEVQKSKGGEEDNDDKFAKQYPIDSINIYMKDVHFIYSGEGAVPLLKGISVQFKQGGLYCLVGKHGLGKSTLMRVLSGTILPTHGDVFIPPHLRPLHVGEDDCFLDRSFLDNIVFGSYDKGNLDRARQVCRRVGLPEWIIAQLTPGWEESSEWSVKMSRTERAMVTIARAFFNDSQVLIVHKPAQYYEEPGMVRMYRLLRDWVDERGLELPQGDALLHRRPRTCFVSAVTSYGLHTSDIVYQLDNSGGLTEVIKPKPPPPQTQLFTTTDLSDMLK